VAPEQIEQQAQTPSFRLSSAFPFFKDCYFLPRVLSSQAIKLPEERLNEAKKLKKIQWLDAELWQASLNDPHWAEQINLSGGICQGVLASKSKNMPETLWIEEERPRLAMDRNANQALDGQLFNFSRIWFHEEGGLYFLAIFTDANSQKQFEIMLSVLGAIAVSERTEQMAMAVLLGNVAKIPDYNRQTTTRLWLYHWLIRPPAIAKPVGWKVRRIN
jgi:CRISPR-associated protein Csm4